MKNSFLFCPSFAECIESWGFENPTPHGTEMVQELLCSSQERTEQQSHTGRAHKNKPSILEEKK